MTTISDTKQFHAKLRPEKYSKSTFSLSLSLSLSHSHSLTSGGSENIFRFMEDDSGFKVVMYCA
jgi:hypothetical protein